MEIKELLTNVNRTVKNNREIKYIVVHYVGAVSTAYNNAKYFENANRQASAHYFVDDNDIYRVVKDEDVAWHCGTKGKYYSECRNSNSIGIEMCCYNNNGTLDISENIENRTIELVKELMAKYNIPAENVIRHYDVTHKICPAPFVNDESRWTNFKNKLVETTENVELKSIDEIAQEVIQGDWGNGSDRKVALTNAGYDFSEVQARVNELMSVSSSSTSNKKSNEEIANEVIAGKWGNGSERKTRLAEAGYDYNAIQKIVNRKLR